MLGSGLLMLGLALWSFLHASSRPNDRPFGPAAAGEFQLFLLGASTVEGVPFEPRLDPGRLAAYFLDEHIAGRRIEVVNLGKRGEQSSHAVEQAQRVMQHARPESAAIFVYLGDNEFVHFDEGPPERKLDRRLFDVAICDEEERARIYLEFEANLREVIELAREHDISLVLSTVAMHLRDWDPNRSVLQDESNREAVAQHLDRAEAFAEQDDRRGEEDELRALLAVEPRFALAWFRLGRNLAAQGRHAEAARAFEMRIETDGFPTSVTAAQNDTIRALAAEYRVPLLDADRALRAAAEHGLPGFDGFEDNCHPGLEGVARIAAGLAGTLIDTLEPGRRLTPRGTDEIRAHFGLDAAFHRESLQRRAIYCYGQSLLTWDPELRLRQAEAHLAEILAEDPDDVHALVSQGIVELIRGDMAASRAAWRRAFLVDRNMTRARAVNPVLRALAARAGLDTIKAIWRPVE